MIRFPFYKADSCHDGFSLVEFIVIISIFAVIAGIGLFNFRGFQTDVSVSNLAHDLALTLHQAQTGGIAGLSQTNTITPEPIGFQINFDSGANAFEKKFVLFVDSASTFDGYIPGSDILLDTISIQTEDYISAIETSTDGANWISVGGQNVTIYFQRPFPEPRFLNLSDGYLRFTVTNTSGTITKYIVISKIGQIRIE